MWSSDGTLPSSQCCWLKAGIAGSISGRPHSKWRWCHGIGYPLLAAEHSLCKAPWSGTPCRMTSTQSRTMSPLDSAWKPGFSLATRLWLQSWLMPQSPHNLRSDLKCVEWDIKPCSIQSNPIQSSYQCAQCIRDFVTTVLYKFIFTITIAITVFLELGWCRWLMIADSIQKGMSLAKYCSELMWCHNT